MPPFTLKVLAIVRRIPKGRVMSYQAVAQKAGKPKASRAVGSIMKRNYDLGVPCHRVLPSAAFDVRGTLRSTDTRVIARSLGQYNRGGSKRKLELLKEEGVIR